MIVIAIKYAETAENIAVKTGHIKMINTNASAQMLPSLMNRAFFLCKELLVTMYIKNAPSRTRKI